MKYSVCVSALFGKFPAQEGIALARKAGLDNCEFWSWWDKDLDAVRESL